MRLITRRRVYRAFPELDRFDDDRCERFVRAANRGALGRLRAWVIPVVAAGFAFAVVVGAAFAAARLTDTDLTNIRSEAVFALLGIGAVVLPLGAASLTALWARDALLRRRIGKIVRQRGVCVGCRYTLVGLFVDAGSRVTCPECGEVTEVDPSLGELASGEDGRARFDPRPDVLGKEPWFWTRARLRVVRRWGLLALVASVALIVLAAGSYELFLRWQAGVARRERPGPEGLQAYAEARQPAQTAEGSVDAWTQFDALERERKDMVDRTDLPDDGAGIGSRVNPEYSYVGLPTPPDYMTDDARARQQYEAQREAAYTMMRVYRDQGWFDRLDQLREATRAVRPIDFPRSEPATASLIPPELGAARQWARIQRSRMVLAREADDPAEFARGLDVTVTVARMVGETPWLISYLTAAAIEALAFNQMRDVLTREPDERWIGAMEGVLNRHGPILDLTYVMGGEEILDLDTVAWLFERPGQVRLGRFSDAVRVLQLGEPDFHRPLGTYLQNKRAIKARFAEANSLIRMLPCQRPPETYGSGPLILPDLLVPSIRRAIAVGDMEQLDRATITAMIALERYRLRHGRYPEGLETLAPEYLASVPIDPWSGAALRYRVIDPATDKQGRGYLLYSVGADQVDNGGTPVATGYPGQSFYNVTAPQADFILNDRER